MSKIKCKYKFKNAEKFNGNAYCTCHNELCKDIAFCCNDNCQIYEDFKLLKRAEQKLKRIESVATDLLSLTNEYDNCYFKDRCNKCDKVCQYRFVDKILQIIEGEENV